MKTKYLASFLILIAFMGCKDNNSVTEPVIITYSGQYQNVPYNDGTLEPIVLLYLAQDGTKLSGVGYFNGIAFNFTGMLIQTHAVISFDLLNTNVGDLKNCLIDGYFGADDVLTGSYTLSQQIGTAKIRFQMTEKASQ